MRYNRQKLLLKAIDSISRENKGSKTYLVKVMFLLRQGFDYEKIGYNFFPHHYGPYSNSISEDLDYLIANDYISGKGMELTTQGKTALKENELSSEVVSNLEEITAKYQNLSQIKEYVYSQFPDFTVKSNSPRKKIDAPTKGVCSIGYEGETIDSFLNKLIQNNVSILIDVRKNAFSMKPNFRKLQLEKYLSKASILYLHIPELGVESEKRKELATEEDYKELFLDYQKELAGKEQYIKNILNEAKSHRIALMCFEADHNHCHRGILSNNLGIEVTHL